MNESVTQFFDVHNYGTPAMTLRGKANKKGFWEDGDDFGDVDQKGVHRATADHFSKTGFSWKKEED